MHDSIWWWQQPKFKKRLKPALIIGISMALLVGFLPVLLETDLWQASKASAPASSQQVTPSPTNIPTPTPTIVIPPLTVEGIIKANQVASSRDILWHLPQDQVYQVMLGGDVMLGRSVGFQIVRNKDFTYPVREIAEKLKQADLTIVNLENPIIENCPISDKESFIFCSTPGTIDTLLHMGIDGVNLANNHTLNYGKEGVAQTVNYLKNYGIAYSGLTEIPAFMQVRDKRFGMLGYNMLGGNQGVLGETDPVSLKTEVMRLKQEVDYAIVTFHWGAEYVNQPTEYQRKLAFAAVDGGADLVFAHHPHWVQGFEIYEGVPIFYSLGNLVFDQMWSQETREGLVVEVNWFEDQIAHIGLHPVFMNEMARPEWTTVGYGNTTIAKVEQLSKALQSSQAIVVQRASN